MDTLHAAAAVLTDWLLETTLHVAVLFAIVLGVTAVLGRRLPARWRHALWALVLVRLLLPGLPASPASVHNVARAVTPAPQVVTPTPQPEASARPTAAEVAQLVPSASTPHVAAPASATSWPWRSTVALLWLAGAALVVGRLGISEWRFARRVRREPVCDDPRVRAVLHDVLREAGLRRSVLVVRSDLGGGPALTGLLRPRVLVPGSALDDLSEDELRHVLAHEVAHLAAGDVLQNWVLAVLEALHWFDPLVRVASARLRTERETLRDLAATRGTSQEARAAYGRTLLRLLGGTRRLQPRSAAGLFERRGDLRRRIQMIAKGGGGRRAWMLGAGVTAAVALVALTGASPGTVRAQDGSGGTVVDESGSAVPGARVLAAPEPADGPRIEVVRQAGRPEWEARVRAALEKPVSFEFMDTSASDVVAYVGEVVGLNVVIQAGARDLAHDAMVTLKLENIAAGQALRLALRQVDMTFAVVDGVLLVGAYDGVREALDQRFYKIAPIVDAMVARIARDEEDEPHYDDLRSLRGSLAETLVNIVMNHAGHIDDWHREGASIAVWGEVLVVDQDPDTHAAVEEILNMVLTRGANVPAAPPWRAALESRLETTVSFDFVEHPLSSVAAYLSEATGASIVVAPDAGEDVFVTLELTDVSALEAVNWVARQTHLHAGFRDGAVVLTEQPRTAIRMYDVSSFFPEDSLGTYDGLVELISQSVAPVSWVEHGSIEFWDEMLIIRNTEDVHAQVVEYLKVAKRAQEK